MHVNLLPSSFVWRRLARKRIRQWTLGFGCLFFLFVLANQHLLLGLWKGRCEYHALHSSIEPICELQNRQADLANQSGALLQKIKLLKVVVSPDRTTSFLRLLSQGVEANEGKIQIREFQVTLTEPTKQDLNRPKAPLSTNTEKSTKSSTGVVPDGRTTGVQYQMSMRGISTEGESISKLVDELQKSSVFPEIELRSTQERFVSERMIQEFQLEGVGNE
jgi:hypothetical protein